jgi:hypothetical protein
MINIKSLLAVFYLTLNFSIKNIASQGPGKYDSDGRFVPMGVLSAGCFVPTDVLSPRLFCPSGRFVPTDVLSPDVLSGHRLYSTQAYLQGNMKCT